MRNSEAGSLGRGSQAKAVGDLSRGIQTSSAKNNAESCSDLKVTQYFIFILTSLARVNVKCQNQQYGYSSCPGI